MSIHGACLSFPIEVDERGSLRTINDPVGMAQQFLTDLVETRITECVMVEGYGMTDRLFAVMGAGFAGQMASELEDQARAFLPIIGSIKVQAGLIVNGVFTPGFTADLNIAAVNVLFTVRGDNAERNLVFPVWQIRGDVGIGS